MVAASILATRGELSIWLIVLAAATGGFLGDTGSYVLGRTAGAAGRVPLAVEKWRTWLPVGMLCGGRDGLVDHLLLSCEQFTAEVLE